MSCVDETNAPTRNAARVSTRKCPDGITSAIAAKQTANSSCDASVHLRLVPIISTIGLQRGFIVQGISKMLV